MKYKHGDMVTAQYNARLLKPIIKNMRGLIVGYYTNTADQLVYQVQRENTK